MSDDSNWKDNCSACGRERVDATSQRRTDAMSDDIVKRLRDDTRRTEGVMLALNYLGLAIGLSVGSILLSLAFHVWKYKPHKKG